MTNLASHLVTNMHLGILTSQTTSHCLCFLCFSDCSQFVIERVLYKLSCYSGTAVAMEKEPGILKEEHKVVVEKLRDEIERDLKKRQ